MVPRPERLPAFNRLLADPTGLLWLVISPEGAPRTHLRAHRSTGEAVATLELPVGVAVFEVGADYVLGRTVDGDGEERVVLYRYTRR